MRRQEPGSEEHARSALSVARLFEDIADVCPPAMREAASWCEALLSRRRREHVIDFQVTCRTKVWVEKTLETKRRGVSRCGYHVACDSKDKPLSFLVQCLPPIGSDVANIVRDYWDTEVPGSCKVAFQVEVGFRDRPPVEVLSLVPKKHYSLRVPSATHPSVWYLRCFATTPPDPYVSMPETWPWLRPHLAAYDRAEEEWEVQNWNIHAHQLLAALRASGGLYVESHRWEI